MALPTSTNAPRSVQACPQKSLGACSSKEKRCDGPYPMRDCGPGKFCSYENGDVCGVRNSKAVCYDSPKTCPESYEPVCGRDRQNYFKDCQAHAAGANVYYTGKC